VPVERFDCRSRRAARGTVRPRAKSSRKRRRLALPHRSEGRKSVRKPESGGKVRSRWRVRVRGHGESHGRAGTRRWKALRAGKANPFDEGWVEAVLVMSLEASAPKGIATGSVRGMFFLLVRGRQRRGEGVPSEGSDDRETPPGTHGARTLRQTTKGAWSNSPKLASAPSSARSLGSSAGALAPSDVEEA
jgi:hypothetical protein